MEQDIEIGGISHHVGPFPEGYDKLLFNQSFHYSEF